MDVISIRDFSREQIEHVLELSEKMVPIAKGRRLTGLRVRPTPLSPEKSIRAKTI